MGTCTGNFSLVLYDDLQEWDERWGGREVQEGGDICIHIADSLCCTVETNTTLYCNYTPIKKIIMSVPGDRKWELQVSYRSGNWNRPSFTIWILTKQP